MEIALYALVKWFSERIQDVFRTFSEGIIISGMRVKFIDHCPF